VRVELTARAELRKLLSLAWPITLANAGLMSLGLVDVAILGHASSRDLGGASVGRSIGFASVSLGLGVASALDPIASQAIGAGEPDVAWRALLTTLRACAIIWLPTTVLALLSTCLLVPVGVDRELVAPARAFLLGQAPGLALFTSFIAAKSFLQAHGRTMPALLGAVIANVVNFAVCRTLVPIWGAFGAGFSSSIANLVLFSVMFVAARSFGGGRTDVGPSTRKVLRLGLPVGAQLGAEIGVFSIIGVVAGRLGASVVSAHQIAIGLASFTFMGALGVSGATAVSVGHAIGEGRSPRHAGVLGMIAGAAIMACGALTFMVAAEPLVRIFTTDDAIVAVGVKLVRIASLFQLFDGVQGVAAGALRGAGDVRFPFVANVAAHWFVGFPVALILGFGLGWGAPGLWWGLTAGLVLISIALAWRFVQITRTKIDRV
jgi:MATE family multidrug resistance protein